jgi:hypothetical protein
LDVRLQISASHTCGSLRGQIGEHTKNPVIPQANDRKFQTNILFTHLFTRDNKQVL